MLEGEVKVYFKSYSFDSVTTAVEQLLRILRKTGDKYKGPIIFPTKIKKFTINRSPHVDKKSREQFEMRVYKVLVIIYPSVQAIDSLKKTDLPAGVGVEMKFK